ncbi:MAG: DUF4139 domain-containing protein [Candidatus Hydrogenedentes bacterium]|nr:DUF4139 domain-containing protein [Candidatus Hydrogenedentota bacterium]
MRNVIFSLTLSLAAFWVAAQEPEFETTVSDQVDVAITAYNNGLALVRDTRTLRLPSGEVLLRFSDVAQQIRPETVSLRSLSVPGSIGIIEQNYEYDLLSPAKLMEKYVGRKVRLVNFHEQLGFESVEAQLLSVNQGPVYKIGGEIFLGHPGYVVLPELPGDLIAKPSLVWHLENTAEEQRLEATYLTGGVSWKADYVVTLAKDDASLDLAGWVTMNNQSGTTYVNAKLKLVAGDVNVVSRSEVPMARRLGAVDAMYLFAMPVEESFAEYHLYTMPRRTTIKQNQSKQLALLQSEGIRSTKKYEYRGQTHFYSQPMPPMIGEHVSVFLLFENSEENALGMPLPAGVMRVYQEDSEGALQFAGEDRIGHTPKDETVTLRMGSAFDVIGERIQTDYRRIASNVHECSFEIVLRNHKEEDIVVDVVEPMPGDWEILRSSLEFEKVDAGSAVFHVAVPKDGETRLTYRVLVTY